MKNEPEQPKHVFAASVAPTPHGLPLLWVRLIGVLVLFSLTFQHGFDIGPTTVQNLNLLNAFLALGLTADLLLALFKSPKWKLVFEVRRFEWFLLLLFSLLMIFVWLLPAPALARILNFLHWESPGAWAFNLLKVFLLLSIFIQVLRGIQRLFGQGVRPELILAGSFASLIVVGSLLLLLPNATAFARPPISLVDALFTATSAVCVTGLSVRDTGADFSAIGQTVICGLFQFGGLGIITFVAFLSVFSTRALPVPQMVAFRQLVNAPTLSDLRRRIIGILLVTGAIELLGIILVYQFLPPGGDPLRRLMWSVFHTISAFCNAGFALQTDSLVAFQTNPGLVFTFSALIILGGLGFLVIPDLLGYRVTRGRLLRRIPFFYRLHAGQAPGRLTVQTKLAVRVTLLLLALGLIVFWLLEFNHMLAGRSLWDSFLISVFQSVTPRTAGFNTIPIHELQSATLVFLMMLMVIGASPVSMGGGIKTVSFGILLLALRAMVTRQERVEAFGRSIPGKTLFAALSVFVLYVLSASLGVFLLALFDPQMALRDQVFEVISALSTVGLSTGITADLSSPSKLVLCLAMFVGRVGPISLVLSVFQRQRNLVYEFPEEEVVVG